MRSYLKEIIGIGLGIVIALAAIWYVLSGIQEKKAAESVDLLSLVASSPEVMIKVNRPDQFTQTILSHKGVNDIFTEYIPEVFVLITRMVPATHTLLFSIHPQGVVMYTKADRQLMSRIENEVLNPFFKAYQPQIQEKMGIEYHYLADIGNTFLGYYRKDGILVLSYSRRLLEDVAQKHNGKTSDFPQSLRYSMNQYDQKAPVNLSFPSNSLSLNVASHDSIRWQPNEPWLSADLLTQDGNICLYSYYKDTIITDTLQSTIKDTLTVRLSRLFPKLTIDTQLYIDDEFIHFMGCIPKAE